MTDSIPKPIQHLSVEEAAAAIISLINACPRSPWPSEIEAIVAKVAGPASPPAHDEEVAVDHATWRTLVLEAEATLRAKDLKCGDPRLPAAEAVSEAAYERLQAFEAAIWERPARSLGDLPFLADLLCYQMWPGYALTEAFPGNDPVGFDALFEEGPYCMGGTVDTATAALLRAIRDLIGPPKAPDPLFLSPLCLQIREAIGRAICVEQGGSDAAGSEDAFVALMSENDAAIHVLEAQLPVMPQSPAELLARAEIAFYFADRSQDGKTLGTLASDDCFEATSSRLIDACMAYFGARRHVVVRDL